MPVILEFVRKRQGDQEFNVIFSDVGKSRPACNVCPCSPLLSIVINTVTQSRLGRKSLFGSHVPINVWFSFVNLSQTDVCGKKDPQVKNCHHQIVL